MHFDWTVNFPGVIAALGVVFTVGRVLLKQRDELRDLVREVGELQEKVEALQTIVAENREFLIAVGFDRRLWLRRTNKMEPIFRDFDRRRGERRGHEPMSEADDSADLTDSLQP